MKMQNYMKTVCLIIVGVMALAFTFTANDSGLSIGGGLPVRAIHSFNYTMDFNLAGGDPHSAVGIQTGNILPGVTLVPGDIVVIGIPANAVPEEPELAVIYQGRVANTNYIWLHAILVDPYGLGFDPPSRTFRITIIQH